jgi:hypothetical protein
LKLNRIELKKIIYDFNSISNRFMRVDWREYSSLLSKFLAYIDSVEVISDFIKDCGEPSYDVSKEVTDVVMSYGGSYFDIGDTTQQEVTNIYHILKFCSDNDINVVEHIARSYASSNKRQELAKEFNERVSMVLIRHIEGYLTKIGIDMGMDEQIKYSITVNNGQVNLASDNATIHATQNNGIDVQQVKLFTDAVRSEVTSCLTDEEIETVNDNLDIIESEAVKSGPRKGFLKTALIGLQAIKGTAEFGAAVIALVQFIQTLI